MFQRKPQPKTSFPQMEEEVLKFWQENKIFEKSVEKEAPKGDYVFYDGPPFATGLPHYGHIVASTMKDVIPRFKTMQGYRVERKWGWDCHGLPVENLVEKELNLKTKQDIEEMGIDKFNEACRTSVMRYADEWKKFIPRMGRWVDMENDYKTMNPEYMESIWWVFKSLWDKGLIYEGYKSMHLCPRCETTLSNFEVTQGYKEVKDLSVIAKFELEDEPNTYLLAWTTTPWTLPGNVALAVGENIRYKKFKIIKSNSKNLKEGEVYILSDEFPLGLAFAERSTHKGPALIGPTVMHKDFEGTEIDEIEIISGKDLIGKKYKPLFNYLVNIINNNLTPRVLKKTRSNDSVEPQVAIKIDSDNIKNFKRRNEEINKSGEIIQSFKDNAYKIYSGEFVSTEDGTGIVHIAPGFGEDDYKLAEENNIPLVQHVKTNGTFEEDVVYHDEFLHKALTANNNPWRGVSVKPKEDPSKTDVEIIKWLAHNNKLFSKEKYEHSYPHCWRCDTPLLNYATSSWFVKVTEIKDKLLKNNKKTSWVPEHIRDGRFGKWLEGARDWAISRSRFWGAPLPVWRCECGEVKVVGSIEELEKLSGQDVKDLHKQFVDKIELKCEKCGGTMKRIPEVLDCWFESGAMPYASFHYPFENKEKFEENFPAQFIAEGVDQTRGWFYTLMVLSTALFDKPAFQNVIVNGIVLAEDGQKMSKRLKNYPDPNKLVSKYGADAMRYYLMSSPVVKGGDLNFSEKGVDEVFKKVIILLWNVYGFYETYQDQLTTPPNPPYQGGNHGNVLDKWILAKLNLLINEVTENLEKYDLQKSSRPIVEFINELSTWYLRRSRERFKFGDEEDKQNALQTTNYVLLTLSKLMAPFTPFIAESLYQKVKGGKDGESVHLEKWPRIESKVESRKSKVIEEMSLVMQIVEQGLSTRAESGIKVRQALNKLKVKSEKLKVENLVNSDELIQLIKDEINVKEIEFIESGNNVEVELDTEITPELKLEGYAREIVRTINLLRKDAGLSVGDKAEIYYTDNEELNKVFAKFGEDILKDTLCIKHETANMDDVDMKKEVKIGEKKVWVGIK